VVVHSQWAFSLASWLAALFNQNLQLTYDLNCSISESVFCNMSNNLIRV